MPNGFLRELDHWILALLHEKMTRSAAGADPEHVTATDFAIMISDYVLQQVAEDPNSCWSACEIDQATDEAILAVTTFGDDLLAAGLIGAVCELNRWHGEEGIALMTAHGVPADDAAEIAAAIDVVMGKLGARGQDIIHRLTHGAPQSPADGTEPELVAHWRSLP